MNFMTDYLFLIIQSVVFIISSALLVRASWHKAPYFLLGFTLTIIPILIFVMSVMFKEGYDGGPIGASMIF